MVCPACDGRKEVMVHCNRGDQPHTWEMMLCRTCYGKGEITEEHSRRIEEGEKLRADRLARNLSLIQEAARLGITPMTLSRIENGREST